MVTLDALALFPPNGQRGSGGLGICIRHWSSSEENEAEQILQVRVAPCMSKIDFDRELRREVHQWMVMRLQKDVLQGS